jgi:uncharacterized RDD family membrane protein YckC
MKDENVINLVDYIENKKQVETSSVDTPSSNKSNILTKRVYSFIIDVASIFTVHAAILTSFAVFVSDFFQISSMSLKVQLLSISLPYQLGIFLTSYMGYFVFTQTVLDGQTIGQKIYGLKVCDSHGNTATSLKISFVRSCAYVGYYLGCGVFQAVYFMSKEQRSFADIISKTQIIDSKSVLDNSESITIEIDSLDRVA